MGLSLVVASLGYSLVAALQLLVAGASLIEEPKLSGVWVSVVGAHALSSCSFQALEHKLHSCSALVQLL